MAPLPEQPAPGARAGAMEDTEGLSMTDEQKIAAIKRAVAEHQRNVANVKAAEVPAAFDGIVTEALMQALGAKLGRVFDAPAE